jgi:Tol biopolymer transport system component
VTQTQDRSLLWTRSISEGGRHRVEGADNAEQPFWSPDGTSIGFFQDNKLKILAVAGGSTQTLCDAPTGRGASWNTDGTIVFSSINQGPLYRVAASGGPCSQLTTIDGATGEISHRFPSWLPDSEHFLYSGYRESGTDVYVSSLKGPATRILTNASNTTYVDAGYLLFVRNATLTAQRFDLRTLQTTGDPLRLTTESPSYSAGRRFARISGASNTVAWVPETTPRSRLVIVDRSGRETGGVAEPDFFWGVSAAPDGSRAAVIRGPVGEQNVWVYERRQGQLTRLSPRTGSYNSVAMSPDGKTVAYSFNAGNGYNIFLRAADGSGEEREIFHSTLWHHPSDWSIDGRLLLYDVADPKTGMDIFYAPVDGSAPPSSFLQTPYNEYGGRLSPDGKWLAYQSDETGSSEVYVRAFPSGRDRQRVSTGGGGAPHWSQNGRELFMGTPKGIAAVPITPSASGLDLGPATMLFERPRRGFDVSGTGTEFLINALEPVPPSRIVVSVGWSPSVAAR